MGDGETQTAAEAVADAIDQNVSMVCLIFLPILLRQWQVHWRFQLENGETQSAAEAAVETVVDAVDQIVRVIFGSIA